MTNCSTCKRGALEVFEEQCETCFKRDKIDPLVELRKLALGEVSRIDNLLTKKLEKLARSPRHNLNLAFTCICGSRFKTGLDLISHLSDCTGPPKPITNRSTNHTRMMNEDLSTVTEIG